jgi:hypothetical protein
MFHEDGRKTIDGPAAPHERVLAIMKHSYRCGGVAMTLALY